MLLQLDDFSEARKQKRLEVYDDRSPLALWASFFPMKGRLPQSKIRKVVIRLVNRDEPGKAPRSLVVGAGNTGDAREVEDLPVDFDIAERRNDLFDELRKPALNQLEESDTLRVHGAFGREAVGDGTVEHVVKMHAPSRIDDDRRFGKGPRFASCRDKSKRGVDCFTSLSGLGRMAIKVEEKGVELAHLFGFAPLADETVMRDVACGEFAQRDEGELRLLVRSFRP